MIRGFLRRADDICPYGVWFIFAPVGEAISLPQTLPSAQCCRKGKRDDTARRANAVRPYGSWSTFVPVGNPQTFRREQAPALRCAVYLFARRDAPPGASGKGRLHRNVAGKGKRDDTPVHTLPQSRPLADPALSEREPWVRAFIFSTILSLQAVGAFCERPQTLPSARCCREGQPG